MAAKKEPYNKINENETKKQENVWAFVQEEDWTIFLMAQVIIALNVCLCVMCAKAF